MPEGALLTEWTHGRGLRRSLGVLCITGGVKEAEGVDVSWKATSHTAREPGIPPSTLYCAFSENTRSIVLRVQLGGVRLLPSGRCSQLCNTENMSSRVAFLFAPLPCYSISTLFLEQLFDLPAVFS
jgi:hypothetical protein